jgi:hypothetical protein
MKVGIRCVTSEMVGSESERKMSFECNQCTAVVVCRNGAQWRTLSSFNLSTWRQGVLSLPGERQRVNK